MAKHIDSVESSDILIVDKSSFYKQLLPFDLIFCEGKNTIDKGINKFSGGPFSHVLMAWLPNASGPWLTLEATIDKGVHVGVLSDYVDGYDGYLVMTRRGSLISPSPFAPLGEIENRKAINFGLTLLDDRYDWQEEAQIVCHKLCHFFTVEQGKNSLYCSGLQYVMSLSTSRPLQRPSECMPTPEENWTDPSVIPVVAFKGGSQ